MALCFLATTGDYEQAVTDAGLTPYRPDEEATDVPHRELLLLSEFVLADTRSFELGIREGLCRHSTIYVKDRAAVTARVREAHQKCRPVPDAAIFYLLDVQPRLPHDRAELLRENNSPLRSAQVLKEMISLRDAEKYDEMIACTERLPKPLRALRVVREQYALGLNRAGRDAEAEQILRQVIADYGADAETYALLGRVYKERWKRGNGSLEDAIETYISGFECDWRDTLPGINALTLLYVKGDNDPRFSKLMPLVRFALDCRQSRGTLNFYDFETRAELAILGGDPFEAASAVHQALALDPTPLMRGSARETIELLATRTPTRWIDALMERFEA